MSCAWIKPASGASDLDCEVRESDFQSNEPWLVGTVSDCLCATSWTASDGF